jgi:hypothetical protein
MLFNLSMHKKAIVLIIAVTIISFANCLGNGFVGDDSSLIVENPFYRSLKNIPRLLTKDAIADSDAVLNHETKYYGTGAVAYRPVSALTYFMDYRIWGLNPFGYHLMNVCLHLLNALGVYFLLFYILRSSSTAFLAAVLFCVHPLKTEAVCAIGYRADSLALFFMLLSFFCYIHKASRTLTGLSFGFFFLALFSKESVIIYPVLVIMYEWLIVGRKFRDIMKKDWVRHAGFWAISIFYIWIYLEAFPNKTLSSVNLLGPTLIAHIMTTLRIFSSYLWAAFLPFSVKTLPPVYSPGFAGWSDMRTWGSIVIFIGFMAWLIRSYPRHKIRTFLGLWFLLGFLPVSNLVPIVNPMAYRFMYLPSIGLMGLLAILIDNFADAVSAWLHSRFSGKIIRMTFVALCMAMTISLNSSWKSNFVMASSMVRDFPECPTGYLFLGQEYFMNGHFGKAKALLSRGIELGLDDPRAYFSLGVCWQDEPVKAKAYFKKSISAFPYFVSSYIGLGRLYLWEGDLEKALCFLEKSLELAPRYSAYAYMMQIRLIQDNERAASVLLEEARGKITDSKQLGYLENFLKLRDKIKLPIDVGI